ncbi:MAG: HAD family phosphatase [Bacteroidetes bacterium]|nr:MAG: HAD family phosphatase [Bacteroidota bacterium]
MDFKTIIFDFGGVVIDIDPQLTINAFDKLGMTDSGTFLQPDFINNVIRKFERGILTPEAFRDKVRARANTDFTDQEIDDAWNALLFDIPAERIEVIEGLKKTHKILLLSNSNEIHYDLYVRDLQLRFGYREFDELFDKAYFSFDLHLSKPDIEIYEFVMYQHKLNPAETLFIDDNLENINSAKSLGWKTYHLQSPERIRDIFTDGKFNDGLIVE